MFQSVISMADRSTAAACSGPLLWALHVLAWQQTRLPIKGVGTMQRVGAMASVGAEDPKWVWWQCPQWGPGVRGRKSYLKSRAFTFPKANLCKICAYCTLFQNCCVQYYKPNLLQINSIVACCICNIIKEVIFLKTWPYTCSLVPSNKSDL